MTRSCTIDAAKLTVSVIILLAGPLLPLLPPGTKGTGVAATALCCCSYRQHRAGDLVFAIKATRCGP